VVPLVLASGFVTAGAATPETIASGLNNPRGIGFAPNGALYVTEAGNGGQASPCLPSPPQPTINRCYGETGAVTRIKPEGGFKRILTGLPSMGLPNGTAEGGPVDLAFLGTAMYVQLGWGGDPARRTELGGKGALFGSMLHVTPAGTYKVVADVAAHESRFNPSGGAIDSNPYGAVAQPGRRIVADAGANALIEVLANGRTRTFAVLPMIPAPPFPREPVPTSVAEGPDGALYVGQLTGFPFSEGAASVLRISSDGSQVTTFASGFTTVVDVTFDTGGALYVLEVAKGQVGPLPPNFVLGDGRLKRKCPGGATETLLANLSFPGGVAIGPDGAAYLTNKGTSATDGEVLRLPLTPCP
jgi:sugar lactone lactonase YvrE